MNKTVGKKEAKISEERKRKLKAYTLKMQRLRSQSSGRTGTEA